jgi:nucleoside-diphosphate-sugar epimerase
MQKVLLTGAAGFIGSHVLAEALAKGHLVTALAKSVREQRQLEMCSHPHLKILQGSLLQPSTMDLIADRYDFVVHLAGVTHADTYSQYASINLHSTEALFDHLERLNPSLGFLYLSSLSARGPDQSNGSSMSLYGASKLHAEQFLTRRQTKSNCIYVLRLPATLGPGERVFRETVLTPIRLGFLPPILGLKQRFSILDVRDLTSAILRVIECDKPGLYYLNSTEAGTLHDLCRLAHPSREPESLNRLPLVVANLAMTVQRALGYAKLAKRTMSRDRLTEAFAGDWTCSRVDFETQFGWSPTMKLADTYQGMAGR